MTPSDIATNVSNIHGGGTINMPSWNQTLGGKDWNQWDS